MLQNKNNIVIGFDAKRAFANKAGLGNYARNTLIALKQYFPELDYRLYAKQYQSNLFPEATSFKTETPKLFWHRLFPAWWRTMAISSTLPKHGVDIYHGLSAELPFGIHKQALCSVVTIHDLIFMRHPEWFGTINSNIYKQKAAYAIKHSHKIIALSNQTANDINQFFNINHNKVSVIYQSIAQNYFETVTQTQKTEALQTYNLPNEFILMVGTIEKRKNALKLLEAVTKFDIKIPIVITGKPTSYLQTLKEFVHKHKLENQVLFRYIATQHLPALYQQALCSVFISLFEGFGLPVTEACASKCPVLASNTSCIPEAGGNGALYCNPTDVDNVGTQLQRLITDTTLRKNITQAGWQHAQQFTQQALANNHVQLYKQLLKQ